MAIIWKRKLVIPIQIPTAHTTFASSIVQRPTESQASEVSPEETFFPLCFYNMQNALPALIGVGEKRPSDISSDVLISHLIKGQTQRVHSPLSSCTWHLLWLGWTQLTGDCKLRDSTYTWSLWNWTLQKTRFPLTNWVFKVIFHQW